MYKTGCKEWQEIFKLKSSLISTVSRFWNCCLLTFFSLFHILQKYGIFFVNLTVPLIISLATCHSLQGKRLQHQHITCKHGQTNFIKWQVPVRMLLFFNIKHRFLISPRKIDWLVITYLVMAVEMSDSIIISPILSWHFEEKVLQVMFCHRYILGARPSTRLQYQNSSI